MSEYSQFGFSEDLLPDPSEPAPKDEPEPWYNTGAKYDPDFDYSLPVTK